MTGHGQRLSALDASFLHLESPRTHMHVAWSSELSPPPSGPRPTIEAVRARALRRLEWVPRCRQRLLPAALGLGDPRWIDDRDFDLRRHLFALSEPDDEVSHERFALMRDALLSTPLDRDRPLWQIAMVPLLEGGGLGVVGRVHHAMADGNAALAVAMLTLDVDGEDATAEPGAWSAAAEPSTLERAVDPLVHGVTATAHAARDGARAALRPRAAARLVLRTAERATRSLSEDLLPRAPASQLNVSVGLRRTLVNHSVPLSALRDPARAHGGTLNDAVLAVIAGALRALAIERGDPVAPLKAMIPVDMRGRRERGGLGNRVSMAAVWLPLDNPSPGARLDAVRERTASLKGGSRAEGAQTLLSGLGLLPTGLRAPFVRAAAPGRFNLTISSVPGPPQVLSMFGARVEDIYPVIPMAEGQALAIGTLTYNDHVHFALHADPDALPGVRRIAELIGAEVRALRGTQPVRTPLPVVAPATAGPVGTYENRSAVLSAAGRGGRA